MPPLSDREQKIHLIADWIIGSERLVVFTGAGVSTESGIPDFRSPGGIWTKFDPDDFTIQKYVSDPASRLKQWIHLIEEGSVINAEPNRAHYAVAELERLEKLQCVITQNIDNLHQKAGNSPEKVLELHGTMGWAKCMTCGNRSTVDSMLRRFKENRQVPVCEHCNGLIKPDVVFFGEALPQETLQQATAYSQDCDLFIVIGSSLVVYPAAFMPIHAKQGGARLVIINNSATELDELADIIVIGSAGEIMEAVLKQVKAGIKACA